MDQPLNRQVIVPNRPKIGDRGLSLQFLDTIADNVELMSRAGMYGMTGLNVHYCKLTAGSLKPSGAAATSPQTVLADIFGMDNNGAFVDTAEDVLITNRTNGYFYQNSFVWVAQHPQSGEWHIIWPRGHTIYGQFDSNCASDATQTFSVYYKTSGGVWTDTTDNIATTDPSPVYNVTTTTINSGKRATASLDPRGLVFNAGPLECN